MSSSNQNKYGSVFQTLASTKANLMLEFGLFSNGLVLFPNTNNDDKKISLITGAMKTSPQGLLLKKKKRKEKKERRKAA